MRLGASCSRCTCTSPWENSPTPGGSVTRGVSWRHADGSAGGLVGGLGWAKVGGHLLCLDEVLLERLGDGRRVRLHQPDQVGELVHHHLATAALAAAREPRLEGVRGATREVAVGEPRKEDRVGGRLVAVGTVHVAPRISAPAGRVAPHAVRLLGRVVGCACGETVACATAVSRCVSREVHQSGLWILDSLAGHSTGWVGDRLSSECEGGVGGSTRGGGQARAVRGLQSARSGSERGGEQRCERHVSKRAVCCSIIGRKIPDAMLFSFSLQPFSRLRMYRCCRWARSLAARPRFLGP